MRIHQENKESLFVVIDNRPMFKIGLKSTIQSILPKQKVSYFQSFDEFSGENLNTNCSYFLIRVGNYPYNTIVNNIRKLKMLHKSCKIILYDYQDSINYLIAFFSENINAYLPDSFDENELRDCMVSIELGKLYLNNQIAIRLLSIKTMGPEKLAWLTPTEVKVADFLVRGVKPSVIAKEMNKKISTISTIKSNIFKKANVDNIVDLAGAMGNSQMRQII